MLSHPVLPRLSPKKRKRDFITCLQVQSQYQGDNSLVLITQEEGSIYSEKPESQT